MSDMTTFEDSSGSGSISDRINPIVVRQLRRLVRSHVMLISTILYYSISLAVFGLCFFFLVARSPNAETVAFWSSAGIGPASIFMYIVAIVAAAMLPASQISDELFDLPFSARQRLHGYLFTGIVLSCYFASLSLPFTALSFEFGGSLLTSLLSLLSGIFTGICTTLFFLSFLAKCRNLFWIFIEAVALAVFSSILFASYSFIEMAIMFSHGPGVFWGMSSPSGGVAPLNPNGMALPIFAHGQWLVFGMVSYWLCWSHLSRPKRPMWLDHLVNIFIYVLLSALFAGIWAALRYGGVI